MDQHCPGWIPIPSLPAHRLPEMRERESRLLNYAVKYNPEDVKDQQWLGRYVRGLNTTQKYAKGNRLSPEEVGDMIAIWSGVLNGVSKLAITDAIFEYAKTREDFPAPQNILDLATKHQDKRRGEIERLRLLINHARKD